MKCTLIAVGLRMPHWAEEAYEDYAKRFPPDVKVNLKTVKAETRGSKTVDMLMQAERQRIEAALPKGAKIVVLDERGTQLSTQQLAKHYQTWHDASEEVAFIIGGPDGLDAEFKQKAHMRMRLSDMTLPHAMARVLLIEQIYRAWSINNQHPYHRE